MTKVCPRCKLDLPIESFGVDNSKASGRSPYCVKCNADRRRDWRKNNRERDRAITSKKSTKWMGVEYDKPITRWAAATRIIREEVITELGGRCECCHEARREFLTIDHIHGGGNKHRSSLTNSMWRTIRIEGYPRDRYRLLCYNCNCSIGHRGYCPHDRERS